MYNQCHIEKVNDRWGIYYADCTIAWPRSFKNKNWATRTLNWLINHNDK